MLCNFIKISVSPVKVELYDRPRALSRKLAKSFGCPGKKGRRTDRSMVLSVSVSVLEGKGRGGVALLGNRFVVSRVNSEKHIPACAVQQMGVGVELPGQLQLVVVHQRVVDDHQQRLPSTKSLQTTSCPWGEKQGRCPLTRAGACCLSWNCGAAPWHRYSWKHMSLLTVAHVYAFAVPTEADRKRPTNTHPLKEVLMVSDLPFYSPAWLITRSERSMSSAIELLNR